MPPTLRLCLCFFLLTTCLARPNWHHPDLTTQNDNSVFRGRAQNQNNHGHFQRPNSDEQGRMQRSRRQVANPLFFGASLSLGGQSNFNNHPPFQLYDRQNFRPQLDQQQFRPPGPHPIGQLASTLQNIIGSHLEATIQHNKAVHFGTLDNVFHHPPALPLPCPLCNQAPSFDTSHHLEVGQPQVMSSGMHLELVEIPCSGDEAGSHIPKPIHSDTEKPFTSDIEIIKDIPETKPSPDKTTTTTEQQKFTEIASNVFGNTDKDSKSLGTESERGIDIRFGGGNTEDVFKLE